MTTLKYRQFITEDMADKPVDKLPGIGKALGTKLTESGYPLAKDVYSQLKSFDFDESKFQDWLKTVCGANSKHISDCYLGLKEWDNQFGEGAEKDNTKIEEIKKDNTEKDNANANTILTIHNTCNCQ